MVLDRNSCMYTYKAKLIKVIEGDTIDASVDLGFDINIRLRIKMYGIITPDPRSKDLNEQEKAINVKSKLLELIGNDFIVETIHNKRGKYGRTMGIVYIKHEGELVNVNQLLISQGLAQEHNGAK